MLKRSLAALFGAAALLSTFATCSHSPARRAPATISREGLLKHSVRYTLFKDPEVEPVTRVYAAAPGSPIVAVGVSNPGGQAHCQLGIPEILEPGAAGTEPYFFELQGVQRDILCLNASAQGSGTPLIKVDVDYYYARTTPQPPTDADSPPTTGVSDESTLAAIRSELEPLMEHNNLSASRYNHLARIRERAEESRQREAELKMADRLFARRLSLPYARGPHYFNVVPVRRFFQTPQGIVSFANYAMQGGSTWRFAQDPINPSYWEYGNAFAPINEIPSRDRWDHVSDEGWPVVVCPDKVADLALAFKALQQGPYKRLADMPDRSRVWDTIGKHAAARAADCVPNWFEHYVLGQWFEYETTHFQRMDRYRFCYSKVGRWIEREGESVQVAIYRPQRILALYSAPAGDAITQELTDGREHPFFKTQKVTDTAYSAKNLLPEICVETPSILGPLDDQGIVEGFDKAAGLTKPE